LNGSEISAKDREDASPLKFFSTKKGNHTGRMLRNTTPAGFVVECYFRIPAST